MATHKVRVQVTLDTGVVTYTATVHRYKQAFNGAFRRFGDRIVRVTILATRTEGTSRFVPVGE